MQAISNRLKEIRKEKNLTQQELGAIINVTKQAIANVESCHNKPSIEFVSKLIENLDVNANWFLTGRGTMYIASREEDIQTEEVLKEVKALLSKYGIKKL